MRKAYWFVPALLLAGACSAAAQHGSGDSRPGERAFEVGSFESVSLEGSPDVIVAVGGAPSVRAEGPRDALERLDIRVEGGRLTIGTKRDGWLSHGSDMGHVVVHVSAPALHGASIAGSGDMRIDRAEASDFSAQIGGSGDMDIGALRARQASFSVAGSGNISAAGAAEETRVSIAGSGDVTLDRLDSHRARVTIMGSGNVALRASESVSGSVMGSGDVVVSGAAHCSVSKMGSGDVRCGA